MYNQAEKIGQASLLLSFSDEIRQANRSYLIVRATLMRFQGAYTFVSDEEWNAWRYSLVVCYSSVKLFYKLALLLKEGVISSELLYIFYYREITGYLTEKLKHLLRACGTGLDLEADFSVHDIVRVSKELLSLVRELNRIHEKNGADLGYAGDGLFIQPFEEQMKKYLDEPDRFDYASEKYIGNWVEVI